MFKKFMTLALLVSMVTAASNIGVSAQTNSIDENQTVAKNEKLREVFLKKENPSPVNFEEKDTLNNHQKQKSQGKNFSTGAKSLQDLEIEPNFKI